MSQVEKVDVLGQSAGTQTDNPELDNVPVVISTLIYTLPLLVAAANASGAHRFNADRTVAELREARRDIAELVAACKERDEAEGEYSAAEAIYGENSNSGVMIQRRRSFRQAIKRYRAALRPFTGERA